MISSNGRKVKVYRFANQSSDLTSRLSKAGRERRFVEKLLLKVKIYKMWKAKKHAMGNVANSPFVSVVLNPDAAANTTDPWLRDITRSANYLYELDVPEHLVITPDFLLSTMETERLVLADDLTQYVTNIYPNPYICRLRFYRSRIRQEFGICQLRKLGYNCKNKFDSVLGMQ